MRGLIRKSVRFFALEPGADGSVFGAVVAVGGVQALVMIFTLARSKIAALAFGPAGVGAISLIDQIVGFISQVVAFSLPFAAVKFLSAAHSENPGRFQRLYASFAWTLCTLSILGAGAAGILLYWRPTLLGRDLRAFGGIAIWACLTIPGAIVGDFLATAMASARRSRASALFGLWRVAAVTTLASAGILIDGLEGYYVGTLLAGVGVTVAGAVFLARSEGARFGSWQAGLQDIRHFRAVAGFAGSLYLASFAQPAAILVARYAAVGLSGLEGAGILQSAMALGLALFVVMRQPNALLLVPRLNRNLPEAQKVREAADYFRTYALVIGAAALPLVLFPDLWLSVLYSRQFLAAAPYAYLFVIAQVLKLFAGVLVALLIGLDQIATQLVVALAGFAALAWLSWSLAPSLGMTGIGAAFLAEGGLNFVLSAWWLRARFRFPVLQAAALPAVVLLVITVAGFGAARFRGASSVHFLIKGAVWLLLTGAAWRWARGRGLLGARAVPGSQLSE